jgi:hypothetical protein
MRGSFLRTRLIRLNSLFFLALAIPASLVAQTAMPSHNGISILLGKARSLEARGRVDLASQNWRQILLVDPNQSEALAGLARVAKENGNAEEISGSRETAGLQLGGVDRMQRNLEPMRKQVEAWAEKRIDGGHREGAHLRGVCRGQTRGSETSCAEGALSRISSPSRRSSDGERSGAFPMRSLRRSRSWSQSRDSRRRPSWANSWKLGSLSRSSPWSGFSEGILSRVREVSSLANGSRRLTSYAKRR